MPTRGRDPRSACASSSEGNAPTEAIETIPPETGFMCRNLRLGKRQSGIHDSPGANTNLRDPVISFTSAESVTAPGSTNVHADSRGDQVRLLTAREGAAPDFAKVDRRQAASTADGHSSSDRGQRGFSLTPGHRCGRRFKSGARYRSLLRPASPQW